MPNMLIRISAGTYQARLFEVQDGAWGANGKVIHLPDLARMSGYRHLQHHVVCA